MRTSEGDRASVDDVPTLAEIKYIMHSAGENTSVGHYWQMRDIVELSATMQQSKALIT
ncbi:hypothetical protein RR48_09766 [Papilio machaon]|uniref:Uncharacterized protein n=1 Tax=Papilio machaon TaxID=76193 RepID=A0A194R2T3_PAPMA|nr:hypothetical protein RR48_09766 [Papilio machaon]